MHHTFLQETGKVWDAVLSDRDFHVGVLAIQGWTREDGFAIPVKSLTKRERSIRGPALKMAASQGRGGGQGSGRPEHRGLCLPSGGAQCSAGQMRAV